MFKGKFVVLSISLVLLLAMEMLPPLAISGSPTAIPGILHDYVYVYRDDWGVPHIYASSIGDAYFALGYVMAQDRLFQMDVYRR